MRVLSCLSFSLSRSVRVCVCICVCVGVGGCGCGPVCAAGPDFEGRVAAGEKPAELYQGQTFERREEVCWSLCVCVCVCPCVWMDGVWVWVCLGVCVYV